MISVSVRPSILPVLYIPEAIFKLHLFLCAPPSHPFFHSLVQSSGPVALQTCASMRSSPDEPNSRLTRETRDSKIKVYSFHYFHRESGGLGPLFIHLLCSHSGSFFVHKHTAPRSSSPSMLFFFSLVPHTPLRAVDLSLSQTSSKPSPTSQSSPAQCAPPTDYCLYLSLAISLQSSAFLSSLCY